MNIEDLLSEVNDIKEDVSKSYKKYYEELANSISSEHKMMVTQIELEKNIAKALFSQKITGKNAEEREASKRNLFEKELDELDRLKSEVHERDGKEKLAMIDVEYVRMKMRILETELRLLEVSSNKQ